MYNGTLLRQALNAHPGVPAKPVLDFMNTGEGDSVLTFIPADRPIHADQFKLEVLETSGGSLVHSVDVLDETPTEVTVSGHGVSYIIRYLAVNPHASITSELLTVSIP